MSVSSRDIESGNSFDCAEHFIRLLKGTKLQYTGVEVAYPPGWANLISELVQELSAYSVDIVEITDQYGELELEFEVRNGRSEAKVWRCVNKFRKISRTCCAICGKRVWNNSKSNLCRPCDDEAGKRGNTGTWLDKY